MTVHELLQLRNDVNVCVFLHASPFSQLHVVRFGFDRRFLLRLLFCGSFELIADGGLFLLLLLPDVFQRRHQLTVAALCFSRRMTAMDFEQRLTVLRCLLYTSDIYYASLSYYPYQMYINWVPMDEGNVLYNDKKFATLLYQWHCDAFTEYSKVSDAGAFVKNNIYDFIDDSEKTVLVVDLSLIHICFEESGK